VTAPKGPPQCRRWLWALTAVTLVACGTLAAIWIARSPAPHNDCAVVEDLGRQWIAMVGSVTAQQNGPGERKDLIAIADSESAMSDKIRAAAVSVSNPALKEQLDIWAQGAALSAKSQRDAANQADQPWAPNPPRGTDADTYRGGMMIYAAADALRKMCPSMPRA
jgi:hypothetical protein